MGQFPGARQAASSRLDSMGMGNAGAVADGAGKKPMTEVRYRAAEDPATSCAGCKHFDGRSDCDIVAGNIDPQATCDLFEGASSGGDHIPVGTEGPPPTPTGA